MPKRTKLATRKPAASDAPEALTREIYAVVRAIPRGRVATYGQVAMLAGIPRGHRRVARAMRVCPPGLPWQRVVGKKDARRAQINIQDPEHAARQRALLLRDKVLFEADGAISLQRFGWLPGE
jgi:methylated-DNA-protein-cysteine methyltransferase-like protein